MQEGDQASVASSLHNSGDLELEFGNPEHALEYYRQALPIKQRLGSRKKTCSTLDSIGVAYIAYAGIEADAARKMEDYARALKTLAEVETFASDDAAKAYIYDHAGLRHAGQDNFIKPAELHNKSIEYGKRAQDVSIVAAAEINLAEALRNSHDVRGALEHYRKGESEPAARWEPSPCCGRRWPTVRNCIVLRAIARRRSNRLKRRFL